MIEKRVPCGKRSSNNQNLDKELNMGITQQNERSVKLSRKNDEKSQGKRSHSSSETVNSEEKDISKESKKHQGSLKLNASLGKRCHYSSEYKNTSSEENPSDRSKTIIQSLNQNSPLMKTPLVLKKKDSQIHESKKTKPSSHKIRKNNPQSKQNHDPCKKKAASKHNKIKKTGISKVLFSREFSQYEWHLLVQGPYLKSLISLKS